MINFLLDKKDPKYHEHLLHCIHAIKYGDSPIIVTVEKKHKKRTNPLNRYYFGIVLDYISKETGLSVYELHKLFKKGILKHVIWADWFGVDLTTTNISQDEMWILINYIRDWAADVLSCPIPDPESVEITTLRWIN